MAEARDLALLDEGELSDRLAETRREFLNLRFQLATGQLDNTARLGQVKKEIARLMTVLREREIAEAEGTYEAPSEERRAVARAHLAAADEAARAAGSPDEDEVLDAEIDADEAEEES